MSQQTPGYFPGNKPGHFLTTPIVFSSLMAFGYKLEPPSRRGRITWIPRFGSPTTAFCVTGATFAASWILSYDIEGNRRDSHPCPWDVEWFQKIGDMNMTPQQRKLFVREKWHFFAQQVVGLPLIWDTFFLHVYFRNLVAMTNPAGAVFLHGLTLSGFNYCLDTYSSCGDRGSTEGGASSGEACRVFLATTVQSMAYFATGRLAVPIVAGVICCFFDVVAHKPATLPFSFSLRGTSNGGRDGKD